MTNNFRKIKFFITVMIISTLIVGIMSSYASPELTTLFKWILEPQSKTIQSETLNQTQTAAKTTMTIMPDRKSTRLNSSHIPLSRMPSSA